MKKIAFIVSVLVLCALSVVAVCIGVIDIPLDKVFYLIKAYILGETIPEELSLFSITIWTLRLPRIIMSIVAGAALAVCGAAFQAIFRNPICDPYILGISSGASLGAAVAIILGIDTFLFGLTGFALISALITLLIIVQIASVGHKKSMETILLAGVSINFLISSVITLLMVLHQESLDKIIFWTMGSFASVTWNEIGILSIVFAIITFFLFYYAKSLNVLQLGDDIAQSSGIGAQRTRLIVLILSSILVATTVAFCGVIGFIGLIIPHIVRILFGNNNLTTFSFSIVFGAIFCLLADTLARSIAIPAELPVGSITAIAGAPYFIFLLLTHNSHSTN